MAATLRPRARLASAITEESEGRHSGGGEGGGGGGGGGGGSVYGSVASASNGSHRNGSDSYY